MHKITGDITEMAAQIPALFESLSGMPLSDLFAKVRLIGDNPDKPKNDKSKGAAPGAAQ
jgi:flotillin